MKRILFITAIMLIISCKKEETAQPLNTIKYGTATFYTSIIGGTFTLVVDGKDKGTLKKSTSAPQCSESGFITLSLSTGNHTQELKDIAGGLFYKKTFFITEGQCCIRNVQ